jgi:hypothetical protein
LRSWVEPKFLAEVEYRDITADGLLRAASFAPMCVRRSRE